MQSTEKKQWKSWIQSVVIIALVVALVVETAFFCGQLQQISSKMNEHTGDIVAIGEELGLSTSSTTNVKVSWAGKKWVSYGDSITQMGGWQDYITEYFGFAEHYERGLGSSTFVKSDQTWYANPDGSYNSRYGFAGVTEAPAGTTEHEGYMCSEDRIKTMIPSDVDLVVVMAGTNDAGITVGAPLGDLSYPFNEDTFMGAVASTVIKIQKQAPNAMIVLASPLSGRGPETEEKEQQVANQTEPEYNLLGLTTQDYAEAMEEVAMYLSIPYVDIFGSTGINSFNRNQYIGDIVHPNEAGQKAIARVMIGALDHLKPVEKK